MTIITSIFLLNRRYDSTIIVGETWKLTEIDRVIDFEDIKLMKAFLKQNQSK